MSPFFFHYAIFARSHYAPQIDAQFGELANSVRDSGAVQDALRSIEGSGGEVLLANLAFERETGAMLPFYRFAESGRGGHRRSFLEDCLRDQAPDAWATMFQRVHARYLDFGPNAAWEWQHAADYFMCELAIQWCHSCLPFLPSLPL